MGNKRINYWELIEKYRVLIGGVLLLLIIASSGRLIYKEYYRKVDTDDQIEALSDRISTLENQIDDLSQTAVATEKPAAAEAAPTPVPEQPKVAGASTPSQPVGKINLNTATAAQLDTLSGIGPAYAKAIIDYRASHGGFKTIEEIQNVKGIGPKTFEKLKDRITVQ